MTGGIQTTGNYLGRAATPEELMADPDMVLKRCPADGEWFEQVQQYEKAVLKKGEIYENVSSL